MNIIFIYIYIILYFCLRCVWLNLFFIGVCVKGREGIFRRILSIRIYELGRVSVFLKWFRWILDFFIFSVKCY